MKIIKTASEGKPIDLKSLKTLNDMGVTPPDIKKMKANKEIEKWCYREYSVGDFLKILKDNKNIWAQYKFEDAVWNSNVLKNKEKYEDFVAGFLHYYDMEVRNGMIDHAFHCHWGKWLNIENCVTIFMDPAPTTKIRYNFHEEINKYAEDYYKKTQEIAPPSSIPSDPPKPPPPPPPY